jgi:HlyD family secretion protein
MQNELATDLQSLVIPRSATSTVANTRRRWPVVAACLAAAALAGGALVLPRVRSAMTTASNGTTVHVVRVAGEAPARGTSTLTATGFVVPQIVSHVAAKRAAAIAVTHVREGARVEAGELLFVLDSDETRRQLLLALARARVARARAGAAEASLREQSQKTARDGKLALAGAIPAATLDDELARQSTLANEAAAAAAERDAAFAEVSLSRLRVGDTRVLSPMRGVVVGKPAQPGDMAAPDAPIAEIVDMGSLRFEVDVPEARLGLVTPGEACTVVLDAYPQRRFSGVVAEMVRKINRAKATGTVKVSVDGPLDDVFPDMGGRVTCAPGPAESSESAASSPRATSVPADAIVQREGRDVVFVVEAEHAHSVAVTRGAARGEDVEITAGPAPGALVVRDPPPGLADGQRVETGER